MGEVNDKTAAWVKKLNKLARQMDDICNTTHPTSWAEQVAHLHDKYRRLAKQPDTKGER